MYCTLKTETLREALEAVRLTVPLRTSLPVLSQVLLKAEGGSLRLTGTDLDNRLELSIEAGVHEPGSACAPLRQLQRVLLSVGDAETVELWNGKTVLALEAGGLATRLEALPPDEFPSEREEDDAPLRAFTLPTSEIARIQAAAKFVSSEETRPILNGVCLRWGKGGMTACGTNGHHLLETAVADPAAESDTWPRDGEAIIQPRALSFVDPDGDPVQVEIWKGFIRLQQGRAAMVSRLIKGPYPNWRQVIPQRGKASTVVEIDRLQLLGAAQRASAVLGPDHQTGRGTFRFDPLDSSGPAALVLSVNDPCRGWSREELVADVAGDGIEIGLNVQKLARCLEAFTDESVRLHLTAPERAVLFEADADVGIRSILMPLRVFERDEDPPSAPKPTAVHV